ncbi:MAG: DUF3592 domain-containing protein [Planctomycetota bacterium]
MWNSKPFVIFFSVVAAVSVLFLFLAWRTVQLRDHLLNSGIQTQGKVVEHYVRIGSRGYGQNHHFVYRFLDSRERSHEGQVIRNEPENRFKVGQVIEIIYDPLDPGKNIPSIMMSDDIYQPIYSSLKFMAVALGVTFAFGAFVFSRFAQTRLRWASLKRLFGIVDR